MKNKFTRAQSLVVARQVIAYIKTTSTDPRRIDPENKARDIMAPMGFTLRQSCYLDGVDLQFIGPMSRTIYLDAIPVND